MNRIATLRVAENERVLWSVWKGNAVQLVNDAEDSHAEFLATGWSARAVLGGRRNR